MVPEIQIVTGSSTPLYGQIIHQIGRAIAAGELVPGDQLPSVRALAERILVNPNTVARAYGDLVRDRVLESQRGKGIFVAERRQIFSREERRRRLDQALEVFLHEVRLLDFSPEEIVRLLERSAVAPFPKGVACTGGLRELRQETGGRSRNVRALRRTVPPAAGRDRDL